MTKIEDAGPGPWDDEPDRVEFVHAGLPCLLRRGPFGHWCGYVGFREGEFEERQETKYDVHGGVTHNGPMPFGEMILWAYGFDCAQIIDYTPIGKFGNFHAQDSYRTESYARAETEKLAEQIRERIVDYQIDLMKKLIVKKVSETEHMVKS